MSENKDFWPSLAIQDGDWKLLINGEGHRRELYNTKTDWKEQTNQAAQNPAIVKEMQAKLDKWVLTLPKTPPTNCFSLERDKINFKK